MGLGGLANPSSAVTPHTGTGTRDLTTLRVAKGGNASAPGLAWTLRQTQPVKHLAGCNGPTRPVSSPPTGCRM